MNSFRKKERKREKKGGEREGRREREIERSQGKCKFMRFSLIFT